MNFSIWRENQLNEFIDILGQKQVFQCLGCDIASHKVIPPGGYVYEDDFINVSADPEIPISGFMVLGVNKHVKSFNDFTEQEAIKIMLLLRSTISIVKEVTNTKEVLIIQEEKSNHFHIWIVPMYKWTEKYGKKVQNIGQIIQEAKEHFNENQKQIFIRTIQEIKKRFEIIKEEKT